MLLIERRATENHVHQGCGFPKTRAAGERVSAAPSKRALKARLLDRAARRAATTSAAASVTGRAAPSSASRIITRSCESRDGLEGASGGLAIMYRERRLCDTRFLATCLNRVKIG